MTNPEKQILIELTAKQQEFAEAVFSGKYSRLLFGGAIRGGKTVCALALLFVLCRIYPGSRWAVVRKDLPTLRRNTIPSFYKFRPTNFVGDLNRSTWTAKCANGSEILFFPESLKDDPDLDRWKGLEVNGFVLEEANELSEKSYHKAEERAGSWKCPGDDQPLPLILMTCNPAKNYVKRLFYDPWKVGVLKEPLYYLPAKITDNPHLTDAYRASLEQMQESDPTGYKRFVQGDWEVADDPSQLIKYEWILEAKQRDPDLGKKRLGVDVARYGDDDTAICEQHGNTVVGLEYHHGLSITRTAQITQAKIVDGPVDADQVKVDGVGLGAGVVDNLHEAGFEVVDVIAGAKPIDRSDDDGEAKTVFSFKNLRSQLWWEYREGLRTGRICFAIDDHRLFEDLTAPRYSITKDRMIQVESKDDMKKRLGRSPDAADAAILADADMRKPEVELLVLA